jgi:hypothetical protein
MAAGTRADRNMAVSAGLLQWLPELVDTEE